MIHGQLTLQRRNCPLMAVATFADPARNSDGFKIGGITQIQAIGIDDASSVTYLTAKPNCIATDGRTI